MPIGSYLNARSILARCLGATIRLERLTFVHTNQSSSGPTEQYRPQSFDVGTGTARWRSPVPDARVRRKSGVEKNGNTKDVGNGLSVCRLDLTSACSGTRNRARGKCPSTTNQREWNCGQPCQSDSEDTEQPSLQKPSSLQHGSDVEEKPPYDINEIRQPKASILGPEKIGASFFLTRARSDGRYPASVRRLTASKSAPKRAPGCPSHPTDVSRGPKIRRAPHGRR